MGFPRNEEWGGYEGLRGIYTRVACPGNVWKFDRWMADLKFEFIYRFLFL